MSRGNSNRVLDVVISMQKRLITNMDTFLFWMNCGINTGFITLAANAAIVFMLTEFTTLKITLSHDGVGIYIAFCVGLAAIDVIIGLISLGVSHDSIITNTKLIKIVHIFLCLIFLTALILCSLYFGNKSYNNYQNYRQATNYILEKYDYKMDIDENSIIQNKGFEAKPLGWFHDLEYMKRGSAGSATVNIDFEYTPDNTTVEEINMNCNLMEDNSLTEITDMCNLAKQLYPYEMLESLETQTLDLIQQYITTQEEQHISYIVSDTQYSVSVNNTETENCDYSLGIRIFYFGDGTQSSF